MNINEYRPYRSLSFLIVPYRSLSSLSSLSLESPVFVNQSPEIQEDQS
jgi:hypothetical protein